MVTRILILTAISFAFASCHSESIWAQSLEPSREVAGGDADPTKPTYSNPVRFRWKVGVKVTGARSTCKNMIVTIPIPTDWPEQTSRLGDETVPTEVRVIKYRTLDDGVRQMISLMPSVRAGEVIELTQIYDVEIRQVNPPSKTDTLKIPKRVKKDMRPFLGVSPQISFRNSKMRSTVKKIVADKETDWEKVQAVFDWVRDNIEQQDDIPSEDTVSVFRKLAGNSEDKAALFVAMCRILKCPARMVWVEGNQYAEFYLENEDRYGHWYPCQLAGFREFGAMSDPRVILQKGDNIKVPEKEAPQKFLAEFAIVKGTAKPTVEFIRELLPAEK